MKETTILTAESVTEGHPDKLCDLIADRVLDECLKGDKNARVACEVMATAGKIIVAGEITAAKMPDISRIVRDTVIDTGYTCDYEIEVLVHGQSPDIAGAVNHYAPKHEASCAADADMSQQDIGAGDQGIMYGYADNETDVLLPLPVVLAHRITMGLTHARHAGLIKGLRPDGKSQVSVEYKDGVAHRLSAVVVSCQHDEDLTLEELRSGIMEHVLKQALAPLPLDEKTMLLINPSGRFVLGGFEADTGLTGRKLMVDTYGGIVPHGGGALSGKDGTKVDRSGAYMARYIAKNIVAAGLAKKCTVSFAYAIGKPEPVAVDVDTHGTGSCSDSAIVSALGAVFKLSPSSIISTLGLNMPIFQGTTNYGHFTKQELPWERTDRIGELQKACKNAAQLEKRA
ncbi:MAG: methionine adenosyltransferase [Clostridia bacterium]